ncbi:MAG: hypothetical protein R3Y35_00055 [Clostridia bacterium]
MINYKNINVTCYEKSEQFNFAFNLIKAAVDFSCFSDELNIILVKTDILKEQEYSTTFINDNTIEISYTYINGMMYALIDIADQIKLYKTMKGFKTGKVSPYIKSRGVKLNIPLDARTPSYSDESDSAQLNMENMWDFEFWKTYFDELAKNKYNAFSFWTFALFPSLVIVDDYPLASLDDVKKTTRQIRSTNEGIGISTPENLASLVTVKKITIEEKIKFWQSVMEYAASRCVEFYVFTWNVFDHGLEGNPYGIDDRLDNPITEDYFKKATKALIEAYPLLRGLGVTTGEKMSRDFKTDAAWLRRTYGIGVENAITDNPTRKFKFIHRLQYTNIETILDEYKDFKAEFEVSVKYSQAHMHAAVKPTFTDSTLKSLPNEMGFWLTVRNDDIYMTRLGDPKFAREYIKNMPKGSLDGFFMGSDGYTMGREYISRDKNIYGKLLLEKMWYNFAIWGKTAFSPDTDFDYFKKLLSTTFKEEICDKLFEAWSTASSHLCDIQSSHWRNWDWGWYPEACCEFYPKHWTVWFDDINSFMEREAEEGTDKISVPDYCESIANNEVLKGVSPLTVAKRVQENALKTFVLVDEIENCGDESSEFIQTISDIKALNYLGYYYGLKMEAAIELRLYKLLNDTQKKEKAIILLTKAKDAWCNYSSILGANYIPQYLTRFKMVMDIERFNINAQYDIMLASEY